jgi:hypothetical protein
MDSHQFAGLAGHHEAAGQIDIEDPAKQLDAGVEERHVAANSGRIDKAADRAETGFAALHPGDHAGLVGDVHDHASCSIRADRFQLGARGIQRTLRQIGNHDLPAIAEQGLGNRQPNTRGPAGHDCNAAIGHDGLPFLLISQSLPPAS